MCACVFVVYACMCLANAVCSLVPFPCPQLGDSIVTHTTVLLQASSKGAANVVRLLLQHRAVPDQSPGDTKVTPLMQVSCG